MTQNDPAVISAPHQPLSETTRFMCASAFLGHDDDIRKKVRTYVADRHHAMADNHGLDVVLLARVLDFNDQKKFRHYLWHGPIGVVCFLVLVLAWFSLTPDTQPMVLVAGLVAALVLGAASYRRYMRNHYEYPLRYFTRETFDAETAMNAFQNSSHKLEDGVLDRELNGNVTVFGGFDPFVGAGGSIGDWSLLIDTRKGSEGATPSKFAEADLDAAIALSFQRLPLPDLEIADRLFVHGVDAASVGLLPDFFGRPSQSVDEGTMARFRSTDSHLARVYKMVAVSGWGDQVRVSLFYRIILNGPVLYIENHSRVLQPVWVRYREIDNLVPLKADKKFGLFIGQVVISPIVCLIECFGLFAWMRAAAERRELEKAEKERIEEQARYNYGCVSSLRESFSTSIYDHFFEKSDRDLYVKTFQKQFLDAILEFLDSKNVDTSDFREQRTYIINSGLIVHGGLQAEALAVGEEAQATAGKKDKPKKVKAGGKAA